MYELVTAFVKENKSFSQWEEKAIGEELLMDIFSTYKACVIVLTHPLLDAPVSLDLESIRASTVGSSVTLNQFLIENGNTTLPTQTTIPSIKERYVKYNDAVRAGYKVYLTDGSASIDDQTREGKTDIKLMKSGIDFEYFYHRVLVSINGFIHRTDFDVNGAYVRDCVASLETSGCDTIGLISFDEVARLDYLSITEEMIYKRNPEAAFKDRIDIKFPYDVSDKSIGLVLGGYLHLVDQTLFTRTGPDTITIKFDRFNFINRYFESKQFLNLDSLGLSTSPDNPDFLNITELLSDEVIKRYLMLSQSFIILIDSMDMASRKEYVYRNGKGLQTYGSGTLPDKPLFMGRGMIGNYWSKPEFGGQYSLSVVGNRMDNFLYQNTPIDKLDNIDNATKGAFPGWQYRAAPAYMLNISTRTIW